MAQTLLIHPLHGSKFALSAGEIENDAKFGWTRYNSDTPVEVAPEPVTESPKRKYTRKVTEQPVEQPNDTPDFLAPVSEDSEGK